MPRVLAVLAVGMCPLLIAVESLNAQSNIGRPLIVRTYNVRGLSGERLEAAWRTAEGILRTAGIGLTWRDCRTVRGPSATSLDRCEDLLQDLELVLRIVDAPADVASLRRSAQPLGFSYVDVGSRAGTLATVFADRIEAFAIRSRTEGSLVLGRAIAHEIGHLLLGTIEHSTWGLMRSEWPDTAPNWDAGDEWRFSSDESAALRRAVFERATMLVRRIPAPR
jgi:hypothetical protein